MNIDEFNNAVSGFLGSLNNQLPVINASIAQSGLSLIHDRILNEGVKGAKYSTNPLPTYYFIGKSISSGGDEKVKSLSKKNKGKGISYTEFRQANNLQTNHVDLRLSGDMWRDMAVLESSQNGLRITTDVGTKDSITYPNGQKTGDVVGYLALKYGDFLTPTSEEEVILDNALDEELQNLIDKFFA